MYGYLEEYELILDCAKKLQDHIESIYGERGEIPQVFASLSQCQAGIEVDELLIWHSEMDQLDITPELIIELFTKRCNHWAKFATGEARTFFLVRYPNLKEYKGTDIFLCHAGRYSTSTADVARAIKFYSEDEANKAALDNSLMDPYHGPAQVIKVTK